jgi:hypothetical protein
MLNETWGMSKTSVDFWLGVEGQNVSKKNVLNISGLCASGVFSK